MSKNQLNEVRLGIGVNDDNFAWQLSAGESFETPVALMTFSNQGLGKLTQESQLFIQDHIMPKQFAHAERQFSLTIGKRLILISKRKIA